MTDLIEGPDIGGESTRTVPWAPDPPRSRFSYGTLVGRIVLPMSALGVGLVTVHALGIPTPACPLRSATGFPCPFCGLTHVARDVLTGQIATVARHDPAGLLLAAIAGVAVVAQVVAMVRRSDGPAFMTERIALVVIVAVLAAHWVTTIITGGMLTT